MTSKKLTLIKFVNVCPLIPQKHHLGFFFNLSYQKEQDFWYYKMCTDGDKSVLKQSHTFAELRLCNIY